ncbi:kinase-like protein [Tricholoma matsutake]|nr:kinase-like protein [Tricholoma matsutake 945]
MPLLLLLLLFASSCVADFRFDILDIVLVASVDGKLHALNRSSGHILWSTSTISSLVRTVHDDDNSDLYIIEPQSGDIYLMATPTSPLQRFPFSMSELVDMSPFSFSGDQDRRVFVGRKETSLLLIELETGKIKAILNSECPWDPFDNLDPEAHLDLDELERNTKPTEIFIGRTDYHISIHTRPLDPHTSPPPVQNLSFSTYGPNNQDNLLQSSYRRTKDDAYIQSLPNGEIISFKARTPTSNSQLLWGQPFPNPIVAAFDVLRTQARHTFVLLQPRPNLQDILPTLTHNEHFPNLEAAYVGMVPETDSLFAMSPSRFPLVAFSGGTERYGNGLIDASEPAIGELPSEVDAITQARKYREKLGRCDEKDLFSDRRCLVGVRPVDDGDGHESRMRRLLDGPAGMLPIPRPAEVDLANGSAQLTLGGDDNAGRGTPTGWEVVVLSIVLGMVSLWFAFRRLKKGKRLVVRQESEDEHVGLTESNGAVPDTELPSTPHLPPTPKQAQTPVLLADDGEESEGEGDAPITPGKRKVRRGRRGKKKKLGVGIVLHGGEDGVGSGNENGSGNGNIVEKTPSLVVNSSRPPEPVTPSLIVSDTVLGFGSHGTVVFQGSLQGRAVAVKRLLKDFVTLAAREVTILQESDDHPNVIRYYYQESQHNFLYIALELCPASLADIVENPDRDAWRHIAVAFEPKKALRQITSGLRHLHGLKLVHRDIKPQNILISGGEGRYRMLISDFGLCKKLDVDQTSFLPTTQGAMAVGTVGWRAPEILRGEVKLDEISDEHSMSSRGSTSTVQGNTSTPNGSPMPTATRLTKSVDIFALGCVFYYTLTNGAHPFGDRFEREVNILKNAKSLEGLERFGEEGAEAVELIGTMLDPEARERPDTLTCLLHPFFWDPGRRLNFLQDASDRFEIMSRDPRDPYLFILEKGAQGIVGNDWHTRLDKILIDNLGKFRKYDGRSVQDLLRALRNKKHHYQDMPDNVKRHLGAMPEGFLAYFTRRFPRLFLHVHQVIGSTALRTESMFRSYFQLPD